MIESAALDNSTTISITIGAIASFAGGLVWLGWLTGRLFSRLDALAKKQDGLVSAVTALDKAARADAVHFGQRWHDLSSIVHDHELQLALLNRELGLPIGPRSERTPVQTVPRRPVVTESSPSSDE